MGLVEIMVQRIPYDMEVPCVYKFRGMPKTIKLLNRLTCIDIENSLSV